MRYTYLGDRLPRPALVGMQCDPVRRADGRCVVGMRMAAAMVRDAGGGVHVVAHRRLRVNRNTEGEQC